MPAFRIRLKLITSNIFPENGVNYFADELGFPDQHARVLLCIAHDPGMRLRDIATHLNITERCAHGIVNDLTAAG